MLASKVPGVDSVTLRLNGTEATFSGENAQPKSFVWPGDESKGAGLRVDFGNYGASREYATAWGVFRMLQGMKWTKTSAGYSLEWVIREHDGDGPIFFQGNPLTLRFVLQGSGAPIFSQGYFVGLECVPKISQ
jgi:type VI protein secretion system component VasK